MFWHQSISLQVLMETGLAGSGSVCTFKVRTAFKEWISSTFSWLQKVSKPILNSLRLFIIYKLKPIFQRIPLLYLIVSLCLSIQLFILSLICLLANHKIWHRDCFFFSKYTDFFLFKLIIVQTRQGYFLQTTLYGTIHGYVTSI